MKKIVLFSCLLAGCLSPVQTRINNIHSVRMQDADAFILMVDDGSGALVLRKVFADDVRIIPDVPEDSAIWAEVVDVSGELRGEGDRLILHVHSIEDVVR